jgi:YidC/Oxa1 family membrane protein insertase
MNFDRNTVIGLGLMILLVIGFSWYNTPSPEEQKQMRESDSLARAEETKRMRYEDSLRLANQKMQTIPDSLLKDSAYMAMQNKSNQDRYGIFASSASGKEQRIEMLNNKMRLVFSTRGGMIREVKLLDGHVRYWDKQPVLLWDDTLSYMGLNFQYPGVGSFQTNQFVFEPSSDRVDATKQTQELVMRMRTLDPAKYLELIYEITPDDYAVKCKINWVGMGDVIASSGSPVKFEWNIAGLANEKGIAAERSKSSVYFKPVNNDRDYLSESKSDQKKSEDALQWVAFKQDYFTAGVIAEQQFAQGTEMMVVVPEEKDYAHNKYYNVVAPLAMNGSSTAMRFYFGPNDYKILSAQPAEDFDRIIDYGWSIIGMVNKYLVRPLFWFLSSFIGSFGLIILIVTLVIKTVLFPVTWKNFLSSAKMRVLKPEMDEINKKYENKDAVEKQQATMALYRQTGVNPFAGCIPVLIQMPILYAMFRFFPAEIVLRGKSFLWADDLAAYDSIFNLGFDIPFYGSHVSGFTLLMCASTFVYTRMSMGAQPQMTQQPGMPNMKVMMNLFTFMMVFFFNSMPSGLSMYYFTANVISIGQMWVIKNYIIDEDAIRAKIEANKKKPKKQGGFAKRLEEMQKAQQDRLNQQRSKLKK